ncbi:MAG: SpoIIE family protein phosphatase [Salinivirgaceae bacterium]|jgi:serine phosphatase RsbU (regulator of sigma subunit)|nr:SpoIIE family protein phosphatase [Salinivirgaceae bacterium]
MIINKLSIRKQLVLLISIVVFFALFFASVLIYNFTVSSFKQQLVKDSQSIAQMIGVNNQSALAFNDPVVAREVLEKLRENPSIEVASLLTPSRSVFANYIKGERPEWIIIRNNYKGKNFEFSKEHLELVSDIIFDGQKIAVVYLKISLVDFKEQLSELMRVLMFVSLATYVISLFGIVLISKLLASPILHLARVIKKISIEKDYATRVDELDSNTEIGVLYNGFNEMLKEIEIRNDEIIVAFDAISEQKNEIEDQRDYIEEQRDRIEDQSQILKKWNEDIMDSLNYAKTIQNNMLLSIGKVKEMYKDLFILFKPRDAVSGDFYWFDRMNEQFIFSAADCTGHGVPGAMISIVGFNILNQIIKYRQEYDPHKILHQLDSEIIKFFRKDEHSNRSDDGMDLAICSLDTETNILYYAGANNSAYIVRGEELIELPCDKHSLGTDASDFIYDEGFSLMQKQLIKGDTIFLYSDGYMDQFGGPRGKKFMKKRFKELLISTAKYPIEEQKDFLEDTLREWIGDLEQVDDIIIIGVKITT